MKKWNWLGTVLVFVVIIAILIIGINLFSKHYKDAGDIAIDRGIMFDIENLFDSLENSRFDYARGYADALEAIDTLDDYMSGDADTTKTEAEDAIFMLSNYLDTERKEVKMIRQRLNFVKPNPYE